MKKVTSRFVLMALGLMMIITGCIEGNWLFYATVEEPTGPRELSPFALTFFEMIPGEEVGPCEIAGLGQPQTCGYTQNGLNVEFSFSDLFFYGFVCYGTITGDQMSGTGGYLPRGASELIPQTWTAIRQ